MSPGTLLLRQAHPKFMAGETITSQVFMPFPKDEGKLSVYDGVQIGVEDSYRHYTAVLGNESAGVWAVTKAEAEGVEVEGKPDPLEGFPSHACIDFGSLAEKECRKIAKRLKALAEARGCQFSAS